MVPEFSRTLRHQSSDGRIAPAIGRSSEHYVGRIPADLVFDPTLAYGGLCFERWGVPTTDPLARGTPCSGQRAVRLTSRTSHDRPGAHARTYVDPFGLVCLGLGLAPATTDLECDRCIVPCERRLGTGAPYHTRVKPQQVTLWAPRASSARVASRIEAPVVTTSSTSKRRRSLTSSTTPTVPLRLRSRSSRERFR